MAGIGFRLQALVTKGSYLEATSAYLSSAMMTAGPWLAGEVALLLLNSTSTRLLTQADHSLLFATIIIVYAASMLVTGAPQMVITRYLADRLYVKDSASIAPTCAGMLFLSLPFMACALPFLLFAPFALPYRLLVSTLFVTVSLTWMVMICLSAARKYLRILFIFVVGYAIGLGASLLLGSNFALIGSLAGFTFGQLITLMLLIANVYAEFPGSQGPSFAYLHAFRQYWDLALLGAAYMLGLWIDSLLFWNSEQAVIIHSFYHLFPPYDQAKLVAYLATIPASVFFMVHLETHFHSYYRRFYQLLQNKGALRNLIAAREGMRTAVHQGVVTVLKIQGLLTLFLCLTAQDLGSFLGLTANWWPLLRLSIIASGAQFFTLMMMLLLLYIDQRRPALFLVVSVLVCNILLTLLSLHLGQAFYGTGYLVAALVGALLGWFLLDHHLKQLEYLTFQAAVQHIR